MLAWRRIPLVSELEADGEIINCVPDSAIACLIAAGRSIPDPPAAGDALRAAAHYPDAGGTTVEAIAAAASSYGVPIVVVSSWAALLANLGPGRAAFLIGSPIATPAGGPFRRFFPGFAGLHCDAIGCYGPGSYLVVDPRADASSGYAGDFVTVGQLSAFWNGAGANARAGIVSMAPARYSVAIGAGATVRAYTLTGSGCLLGQSDSTWGPVASSAPCDAPVDRASCSNATRARTVRVRAGVYADKVIRVGAAGVALVAS